MDEQLNDVGIFVVRRPSQREISFLRQLEHAQNWLNTHKIRLNTHKITSTQLQHAQTYTHFSAASGSDGVELESFHHLTVVPPKMSTKKHILSTHFSRNLNDEAAVPEAKPAHTKEPKRVGVMGWGGIWW